jgi:hypothetical protein
MAFTPLMAELTNPATRAAMIFAVNREPKFLCDNTRVVNQKFPISR